MNAIIKKKYAIATFCLLLTELIIALYVHDNIIRPYIGDILVVILIYCFIRIFIPYKCRILPIYILIFSVIVEFLQYFDIAGRLGLADSVFFRIFIGSVFDVKDILCYAFGCAILIVYEFYLNERMRKV